MFTGFRSTQFCFYMKTNRDCVFRILQRASFRVRVHTYRYMYDTSRFTLPANVGNYGKEPAHRVGVCRSENVIRLGRRGMCAFARKGRIDTAVVYIKQYYYYCTFAYYSLRGSNYPVGYVTTLFYFFHSFFRNGIFSSPFRKRPIYIHVYALFVYIRT